VFQVNDVLLLAVNLDDWFGVIPFVVMIVVWVLNRVLGGDPQAGRRPAQRPAAPAPVAAERRKVDDEVADFLRRAAQRRGGDAGVAPADRPMGGQPPRPPGSPQIQRPREVVVGQQAPPPQPSMRRAPVETELVEVVEVGSEGPAGFDSIEARTIGTRVGAAPRQSEVEQADEAMEHHVAETFDHRVGRLGDTKSRRTQVTGRSRSAAAERLFQALSRPQDVRQAIIVAEVLKRPEGLA
jgi:hypothetical protein